MNNCSICNRKLNKKISNWYLKLIGYENIINLCEECDLSLDSQIVDLLFDNREE